MQVHFVPCRHPSLWWRVASLGYVASLLMPEEMLTARAKDK